MKKFSVLLAIIIVLISFGIVKANEKGDIEKLRKEQLEKLDSDGLVKPYEVREIAKAYLAKPLSEQKISELEKLAKQANAAANLVGMILSEYDEYYSDNYRNPGIQFQVGRFHDQFAELSNEMKEYRNQCYFNIGEKLKAKGKILEAFLYYRDAHRLSLFVEPNGIHRTGMRYKSEQELKDLLGIADIPSFTYRK